MLLETPKTFSLLSIGQRGVGKTVFLAGSYAELSADSQSGNPRQLWFDCQSSEVRTSIENILKYIAQTNLYPPPTIKVTNFNFSLKRRNLWGSRTLCHFRWWDIPGESCDVRNPDFQKIVSVSHGCCVFIDAYALVHNSAYLQTLENIIEQVMAIANLVYLNKLKYAFALVLTKCDLLQPNLLDRKQLEKDLQPLIVGLDKVKANYQIFYSFIPIINAEGTTNLKATGAAAPLIWLVWNVSKAYNFSLTKNLRQLLARRQLIGSQPQSEEVNGSLQSLFRSADKAVALKKRLAPSLLPAASRKPQLLALIIVASVGMISLPFVDYKRFLQGESNNFISLEDAAILNYKSGRFYQALPLFEKLVQQKPQRLELRLQLAQVYERTDQFEKAEAAYDQVLAKERDNIKALVGKAVIRKAQGDIKTAELLFAQAEKAAPTDLKPQVRAVAQKTLASPVKLIPETK
ncbi:tetratricopeptide repeat protein [Aliterella atlantica]|nr:tetratricopeptide repeat protein [Aliterella atlantica]